MPTAYPIDVPDHGFTEIAWSHRSAVAVTSSPFTFAQQVHRHPGQIRRATCKLPPMRRDRAQAWHAFFLRLNGREGTFRLGCSIRRLPNGVGLGDPVIAYAGQTGDEIDTTGWSPSVPAVIAAGDLVQIGTRLHDVLENTSSDINGNARLKLWPRIDTAHPDAEPIQFLEPRGIFRLDDIPETRWTVDRLLTGLTFTATEAI